MTSKKTLFGIIVVLISVITGVLISFHFFDNERSIPIVMLAWPAVGAFIGLIVIFIPGSLEVMDIDDEIENMPDLISDDVQNFLSGNFTLTHLYVFVTLIAIAIQIYLVFHFRKWLAYWGPVNVLFISLTLVIMIIIVGLKTDWFQRRYSRFSAGTYSIPMIGFIVCSLLGAYYAEPVEYRALSPMEKNQMSVSDDYWENTRSGYYFDNFFTSSGSSSSSSSSDFDLDVDEDAAAALFLIVIVILLIFGSAVIPHFWLIATTSLLTILILICLRELLYSPNQRSSRFSW